VVTGDGVVVAAALSAVDDVVADAVLAAAIGAAVDYAVSPMIVCCGLTLVL
jgi:hypothetical protein